MSDQIILPIFISVLLYITCKPPAPEVREGWPWGLGGCREVDKDPGRGCREAVWRGVGLRSGEQSSCSHPGEVPAGRPEGRGADKSGRDLGNMGVEDAAGREAAEA